MPQSYPTRIYGDGMQDHLVFMKVLTSGSISFLKNLKLVAVDELHYYSNIYGRYVMETHK